MPGIEVPFVLGYDVAGIVDELGADVDHISVGDPVVAMTGFPRGAGGYAEFVVTHSTRHRSSISTSCWNHNITFHGVLTEDDGDRTRRLAELLAAGVLRPFVSHVLPLEEAAQAHRLLESGHAGGKVVLVVDPSRASTGG